MTVRGDFNQIIHTVDRRYREFENLHQRLSSVLSLPHLPGKVLLHRRSSKIIEQRRQLLEIYLNELLRRCQQHSLMPDELNRFLQLSNEKPDGENLRVETSEEGKSFALQHAPCLAIADQCPWTNDRRGLREEEKIEQKDKIFFRF